MVQRPDRPLLQLPEPALDARDKRPPGRPRTHLPGPERQRQRLEPQFTRLREQFNQRRAQLQPGLAGAEPELALVLETAGTVASFFGAVRRIEGLEWLAEYSADFEADDDFSVIGRPDRPVEASIYLVMSDRRAVDELLGLWRRWQEDPEASWDRGWNAYRHLFKQLKSIRPWSARDRLQETGVLDDWRERIAAGEENLPTEIELWFRSNSEERRAQAERSVRAHVEEVGGTLMAQSMIPEIAYHALLASLPAATVQDILDNENVALVLSEEIMFFRPAGQSVESDAEAADIREEPDRPDAEALASPVVALLDGLPVEQHAQLRGRLLLDDVDDWRQETPVVARRHGTAMASLLLHGDLGCEEEPLTCQLYLRPILRPAGPAISGRQVESTPDGVLYVDLIHRAIRRIFEGQQDREPQAPNVVVINLSIGIPARPYDRFVSPLARLLDWASWKYGVLFTVSSGNWADNILVDVPRGDFAQLPEDEREEHLWLALVRTAHLRRVLSPAEGVNALTVGAAHSDCAGPIDDPRRLDPLPLTGSQLPSPFSALGPGVRRAVKPEILLPGGRQLYEGGHRCRSRSDRAHASQLLCQASRSGARRLLALDPAT